MTKVARNKILELRTADPLLSLRQIATQAGVSRQRVQQILKTVGMLTSRRVVLTCACCGREFARKRADVKKVKKRGQERFFCSQECYRKVAGRARSYNHAEIIELRNKGYLLRDITAETGVSPIQASRILKRHIANRRTNAHL